MKKIALRALALILAVTIIAGTAIGCRSESESAFPPPEYVFLPEIVPFPRLPGEMSSPDRVVVVGDTVYFSVANFEGHFSDSTLYSMDIDGTNLRQLPHYDVPPRPPQAESGGVHISFLYNDDEGNLWVVESGNFHWYDLPEDFVVDHDEWWLMDEYWETESVNAIRKLDSDGAELLSVDISFIVDNLQWGFWVAGFTIDGNGNIYVGTHERIDVISPEGEPLFNLDAGGFGSQLIRLPDGVVASIGWEEGVGRVLMEIDTETEGWGNYIGIPDNAFNPFPGNDEFLFLFNDITGLFGFDAETDESVQIVNWIDSDVSTDGLGNIAFLDDGRLFITTENWRMGTGTELVFLTRMRYEDLPERTLLTLAAVNIDWNVREAVLEFNRTSATHRIQVVDYGKYNVYGDWSGGVTRLTTEIIAGRVPDIFDMSGLPYQLYAARGLLKDLYSFIDEDPELNRSDLLESAFNAIEIAGELPFVFAAFGISTVVGDPAVLGATPGWTMEEFIGTLDANPQADMPMGSWLTRESFLRFAFSLGMHNFVDWNAGTVNFAGGDFEGLLEIAKRFPPEPDRDEMVREGSWSEDDFFNETEMIAMGRQIMEQFHLWGFQSVQRAISLFGPDFVFKGFPTEHKNGHTFFPDASLAISTSTIDPDGAWSFVRTVLTEDFQRGMAWSSFPTNRVFFEEELEEAMTPPEHDFDVSIDWGWGPMAEEPLTQAQVDRILTLIDSVAGVFGHHEDLLHIVEEHAEEFFTGQITAQEAARFIQDRAAIYVSEVS